MRRDDVARFLISVRKEMTARDVINELAQCGVPNVLHWCLGWVARAESWQQTQTRYAKTTLPLWPFIVLASSYFDSPSTYVVADNASIRKWP